MAKRSEPALLYPGTSAKHWIQVAVASPDTHLVSLCVSTWRRAASMSTAASQARAIPAPCGLGPALSLPGLISNRAEPAGAEPDLTAQEEPISWETLSRFAPAS